MIVNGFFATVPPCANAAAKRQANREQLEKHFRPSGCEGPEGKQILEAVRIFAVRTKNMEE